MNWATESYLCLQQELVLKTIRDLELEYYKARSQYPDNLVETEATFVSEQGGL